MTETHDEQRELEACYDLISEKIYKLRKALVIEADAARHFQLTKTLEAAEDDRKRISNLLDQTRKVDTNRSTQTNIFFEPYHFDLDNIAQKGLQTILDQNGLIGFAFRCPSLNMLKQCCHRIRYEFGRSNLLVRDPFVIDPKFKTVELGITDVLRHKNILAVQHVMLGVQISDEENANRFWSILNAKIAEQMAHKLIILLALGEGCAFPAGTIPLETPLFERVHAYKWIRETVTAMEWPEELIDFWTEYLIKECAIDHDGKELYPDHVYLHLDDTVRFIRSNPDIAAFRAELSRREQMYVPS